MNKSAEFERFFKENYTQFYLFTLHLTNDEEVSRDIVNDAFEYAWINYDDKTIKNWISYTYSYIRNKSIDYIRHQNVKKKYLEHSQQKDLIEDADNPQDEIEKIEFIRDIIKALPLQTQSVLKLCYYQNRKYKEAAKELGISTNTIKKHIVRAFKVIREEMSKRDKRST